MILIIRGHIRNSFDNKRLYVFVKEIYNMFPNLKIFIHTWNIFANNISWRTIHVNTESVNNDTIYNYFDDLKQLIQHIIIDDDSKIQLIGRTTGNINNGLMPVVGWKNYWYGKYSIIDFIRNKCVDENEPIVNFRFDLMDNSNSFHESYLLYFIKENAEKHFTKNHFLYDDELHCGIDNIYIGNINTMYSLTKAFFYDLDDILSKNTDTLHHELSVYRMNKVMFGV